MPAKTTIATAEKRVIKNEMRTLGRAHKKMLADALKAHKAARRELLSAHLKYGKTTTRIDNSVKRESAAIERRVSILEGRL